MQMYNQVNVIKIGTFSFTLPEHVASVIRDIH